MLDSERSAKEKRFTLDLMKHEEQKTEHSAELIHQPIPDMDGTEPRPNTRVVINICFGGFGLSEAAYEKLIEWGIPVRKYIEQEQDAATGLYQPQPLNDGEVIFDRELTPEGDDDFNDMYWKYRPNRSIPRYWDSWTSDARTHPLIIRVVEELGAAANGPHAELKIIEVPAGVEYEVAEYDGSEHVAEKHRTWY